MEMDTFTPTSANSPSGLPMGMAAMVVEVDAHFGGTCLVLAHCYRNASVSSTEKSVTDQPWNTTNDSFHIIFLGL